MLWEKLYSYGIRRLTWLSNFTKLKEVPKLKRINNKRQIKLNYAEHKCFNLDMSL